MTSSLLFSGQCGLAGPLVRLCRCSSRCDIRLVTADTAKSTSESTTGTKECFLRGKKKLPRGASQHSSAATEEAPAKCNYLNYTSEPTRSVIITNEKEQKPTRALITEESPIHESVVLRSSGGIWLAGKGRAGIGWGGDIFCVDSALGPVTPDALLSSPAMFAAPHTRSLAPLGCTLSSHYFCYSNSSINYALE